MNFLIGLISGVAATLGCAELVKKIFSDSNKPPWISEYYVRSVWLELAGLYNLPANPPLTDKNAKADIVIIGGGLTGLPVVDMVPAVETAVSCRISTTP
jgi:hypothetical protein